MKKEKFGIFLEFLDFMKKHKVINPAKPKLMRYKRSSIMEFALKTNFIKELKIDGKVYYIATRKIDQFVKFLEMFEDFMTASSACEFEMEEEVEDVMSFIEFLNPNDIKVLYELYATNGIRTLPGLIESLKGEIKATTVRGVIDRLRVYQLLDYVYHRYLDRTVVFLTPRGRHVAHTIYRIREELRKTYD